MAQDRRTRRWLALILSLYLLLALAYGLVNPLFEAPDEHWHYFTTQYIAETGRLPAVADEPDEWLGQEAAQPPLYYLLGSLFIRPIDTSAARDTVWPNPFVRLGDATLLTNINAFVHGPWEQWPWQGYALAAHLLRVLSTCLGLGTLLAIYGSGRLLWPNRPRRALLATAVVALLPQFVFLHSSVTNDTLIILLASLVLWQLLYLWQQPLNWQRLLLLALTIGLAALSKMAGFLLLGYAVGFLMVRAWKEQEPLFRTLVRLGGLVVLPALLLSGWLLWRNWQLYGDPTATNQFVAIAGGDRGYSLLDVLAETPSLWMSLFGVFGWFNLRAPDWFYWIWNLCVALALAGALLGWWAGEFSGSKRERFFRRLLLLMLAGWVALIYAALVSFMLRTPAAQGRLLFPALIPLALAFAYGLEQILGRLPGRGGPWLVPVLALLGTIYALVLVIAPAYAKPPLLDAGDIPADAQRLEADVGEGIELLAVHLETSEAEPGDSIWATLYWQAHEIPETAPEVVLEAFGREGADRPVGRIHGYHGRGLYPAPLWPPEQVVASRVELPLAERMEVPTLARLQVGLHEQTERVQLGAVKVTPATWPPVPDGQLALLGNGIALAAVEKLPDSVRPGQTLAIDLVWHVLSPPQRALTTFVHLGEPGTPPFQAGDSPPLGGAYPTDRWAEDEVIKDRYTLALPPDLAPGRYPVIAGMYDPQTLERLPLSVNGERQPFDSYVLGWIEVDTE